MVFTSLPQNRLALDDRRRDDNSIQSHSPIGRRAPAVYAAEFLPQR